MTVRSAWHLPTGQTREDTRLAAGLGMAPAGPLTARPGCVAGGLQLSGTSAASMQAKLSPGQVWVAGTSTSLQGGYPVTVDADTLLTFADGHATLPRVDTVAITVYDSDYDGTGTYQATLEIVQGVPAAAPTARSLPANSEPLFDVAVPAGASAAKGISWGSAVTDRRRYTAALGGILPTSGAAPAGGFQMGQYRDANGRLERWNGTQWAKFIPDTMLRSSANVGATASTGYVETLSGTAPTVTAVFTAPPSTWVHISFGALATADGGTTACISFRVRQQSGTEVTAPLDSHAAMFTGTGRASISSCVAEGPLTPGAVYTATLAHRSSGGQNTTYNNRFIRVDPVA